ncbi:MAG: hypothetical protein GY799_03595 [Desulfobulbaceae bacterium]|nr:hypothetical protein [Desulfobulbaceae bacterium]
MKRIIVTVICSLAASFLFNSAYAEEVGRGKIPVNQLESSYKKLDWGVAVWDVDEAISQLKSKEKVLWIDTRPASFLKKGTVRGAIQLLYNNQDAGDNGMTEESLDKAVSDAGLDKSTAKVIMFCQGPKCHRSYNGTFVAVSNWGYKPENVVWFRAGYPLLSRAVKEDPKLKRKAKKYLSGNGVKQL